MSEETLEACLVQHGDAGALQLLGFRFGSGDHVCSICGGRVLDAGLSLAGYKPTQSLQTIMQSHPACAGALPRECRGTMPCAHDS